VKSLEEQHVLARLIEQGCRIRWLRATRRKSQDDGESGEHSTTP
jgi:hypothetical protein